MATPLDLVFPPWSFLPSFFENSVDITSPLLTYFLVFPPHFPAPAMFVFVGGANLSIP